jgi:hypothetical protein
MSSPGSDIGDGIIPEKRPEHIAPPPRTVFLPWHKVRKQYIRRHQWNALTKRRVEGKWRSDLQRPSTCGAEFHSSMHVARPLRCLVIPGDHLLDLRSLWTEISPLDCFIRYLGFNEGHGSGDEGTEVHVANNSVTSLSGVVPDSQVLRDRFESIAAPMSPAYAHLKHYGPYHVVNLDLCGSMFPNTVKPVEPYYTALKRLLKYQFAAQKTHWLLFITTMVEPAVVDEEWMQRLCKPTRENFHTHNDFAKGLENLIPRAALGAAGDKEQRVDLNGLSDDQLIHLFGVALGKYLLHLGHSARPEWTVEMRRSFRYSINDDKGAVMLSLAFEMAPNFAPPVDATGMSKMEAAIKPFPKESESAAKLAATVMKIADVADKLAADEGMKTSLRDEAADLLASAGFNRAAYIKWVDGGEITPPG